MFRPVLTSLLLPATLAMIAACAQAQVLECTDSQGRKEFGTTCPPGTVSQKELRSRSSAQQGSAPAAQTSWQEQERAFQQRRLERESAETDAAHKQKQQQIAERNCASLRRQMEQLASGRRLRWVDRKTDERPVMTEEEHAVEMRRVEAELGRCRS